VIRYEDFRAELERRKRERWARILASEPPGRAVGRRPRDPEKDRLLARLDRARIARRRARGEIAPPAPEGEPAPPGPDGEDPTGA
jgi:hypothetical protein